MVIKANTETEELLDIATEAIESQKLVLYNDDVNTFDFVIDSLIKVCNHEPEQAEQCTFLVHYKGRCDVKEGSFDQLKPLCSALLDRGLTAEIE